MICPKRRSNSPASDAPLIGLALRMLPAAALDIPLLFKVDQFFGEFPAEASVRVRQAVLWELH